MAPSTALRCILVWQNTVLDDRCFFSGSKVTVSQRPDATYSLADGEVEGRALLIRPSSRGAEVFIDPRLRGELTLSGATRSVVEWSTSSLAEPQQDGKVRLLLAEGDGGVLVFGQTGLGFQLQRLSEKPAPAAAAGLLGLEGYTTRLFALVLAAIVLLSFVSRLFAVNRPEMTIEQLPDRFATIITQDKEALQRFRKEMQQRREEQKSQKEAGRNVPRASFAAQNRPASEEDRLRSRVAKKGVVGALSEARKEGPLKEVLSESGLSISLNQAVKMLEQGAIKNRVLASRGEGGGPALSSLVERVGSGTGTGEQLNLGQPQTGETGRQAAGKRALGERAQTEVQVDMPKAAADISGGDISREEIFQVVTRNKGAIRYCYESQLLRYPTLRGKVVVDFIIELDGTVRQVNIQSNNMSNAAAAGNVASCLVRFIRRWKFPAPRGGKVRVIYPFTFGRRGE